MASYKGFKTLKYSDRLKIEQLLLAGKSKKEIAERIGVHISTVYNEIKRGQYEHTTTHLTTDLRYSPEKAQKRCEELLQVRGTQLKIGNDIEFANYLEHKIVDDDMSPAAVLGELKIKGTDKNFKTSICPTTLYSYIDKGIFLRLTNKELPVKSKKKRSYNRVRRIQKKASAGTSIEKRPEDINTREEFGHWEMDSVIGKKKRSKNTFLVLSERKTRKEIIFKRANKTAEEVVKALDQLERKWGNLFPIVFKSITVDNGTEFAMCDGMERSCINNGKRTEMYYCHPYSSWERGTNECLNKMIRRKVPKGTNFDDMTDSEVKEIEDWMNEYPRKILNYHSSKELFETEINALLRSG